MVPWFAPEIKLTTVPLPPLLPQLAIKPPPWREHDRNVNTPYKEIPSYLWLLLVNQSLGWKWKTIQTKRSNWPKFSPHSLPSLAIRWWLYQILIRIKLESKAKVTFLKIRTAFKNWPQFSPLDQSNEWPLHIPFGNHNKSSKNLPKI